MKHIRLHDYLSTFIESEEIIPVTTPSATDFDESGGDGVDATTNPRISKFDLIEMFGAMPSDGFATEPIPDGSTDGNSASTANNSSTDETGNPEA